MQISQLQEACFLGRAEGLVQSNTPDLEWICSDILCASSFKQIAPATESQIFPPCSISSALIWGTKHPKPCCSWQGKAGFMTLLCFQGDWVNLKCSRPLMPLFVWCFVWCCWGTSCTNALDKLSSHTVCVAELLGPLQRHV